MKSASDGTVVHMRDFRASELGKQVGEALSSVTGALSSLSENFFEEWEKVAVRARGAARSTDEFVQENPWAAAGIAAFFGAAAGFALTRAFSSPAVVAADEQELNDG